MPKFRRAYICWRLFVCVVLTCLRWIRWWSSLCSTTNMYLYWICWRLTISSARGPTCVRVVLAFHRKGVNSLSLHPSGRVALSVGEDSILRVHDLASMKSVLAKKMPKRALLNELLFRLPTWAGLVHGTEFNMQRLPLALLCSFLRLEDTNYLLEKQCARVSVWAREYEVRACEEDAGTCDRDAEWSFCFLCCFQLVLFVESILLCNLLPLPCCF